MGWGLAISYNMAKPRNGTLKVENTPDGWVLFTLSLPPLEVTTMYRLLNESLEYIPKIESQLVLKLPHYEFDKMRGLHCWWLMMNWKCCGSSGKSSNDFNVVTYKIRNGVEQVLNEVYPNVIICDIMMPELAVSMTKRIKSVKETSYIPIIMVSGRHEMEQQMAALSAGSRDVYHQNRLMPNISVSLFVRCWNVRKYLKDYFSSAISSFEKTDGKLTHKNRKVPAICSEDYQWPYSGEGTDSCFIADHLAISVRSLYRKMERWGRKSYDYD